jgi:hypothetical protein
MFPALKRRIMMPFIEHRRKAELIKNIRTPKDIMQKMIDYHNMSLEFEKKGKKDMAKEYQAMSDALKWALKGE